MDINFDGKRIFDTKNDVVFQKIFRSTENKDILAKLKREKTIKI